MEDKKNNGLKSELLKSTDGYREGAIAGALAGIVIAAYLRKRIWIGGLIGLMAGGYIGHLTKNKEHIDSNKFRKQ